MMKVPTRYSLFSVATVLILAGCGGDAPDTMPVVEEPIAEETALEISDASLRNTNSSVPLAAVLTLSTNAPAVVELTIDDGERNWNVTPNEESATDHSLMVLGMRPGRTNTVTAVARDTDGNEASFGPLTYETPPLPDDFVVPQVTVRNTELMEPGVRLVELNQWDENGDTIKEFGTLFYILDSAGEVIWYFHADHGAGAFHRLENGNFLYYIPSDRIIELDMLGNIVGQWHATGLAKEIPEGSIPVETDSFHHEATRLPNGNTLVLGTDPRTLEDYPSSTTDPNAPGETATVIGDLLVEFTPNGTIVTEWSLHDILDPSRVSHSSLAGGYWKANKYEDTLAEPVRDWTHANAMIYDESDHSVIVSVRHQDAVIKVDWASGELVWILGPHDNWNAPWSDKLLTPVGELEWQYHQHGPSFTGENTIVLFDNGTYRASAFQEKMPDPQSYSRAVEFAIDREGMEVSQVWHYGGPGEDAFFSRYICDADWLPVTGNILVTDGARETGPDGKPAPRNQTPEFWSRIVEVTRTDPAEVVFEVIFREELPKRWHSYRAQHMASLYP